MTICATDADGSNLFYTKYWPCFDFNVRKKKNWQIEKDSPESDLVWPPYGTSVNGSADAARMSTELWFFHSISVFLFFHQELKLLPALINHFDLSIPSSNVIRLLRPAFCSPKAMDVTIFQIFPLYSFSYPTFFSSVCVNTRAKRERCPVSCSLWR